MRIVVHLDGDSAGEVLVAVEETCCPVQCVPSVIYEYNDHYPDCELVLTFAHQMRMMKDILLTTYCWALLWCFVRRTQKYPLLCCCHLEAGYDCYMNWEISTTVHETL